MVDRTKRIAAAEAALDAARATVDRFEAALQEFEEAQGQIGEVSSYLGSEAWFDDREARESGEISAEVKAGILSEDLGYDLIVDNRDLAIKMLEIATAILRDL